MFFPDDLTTSVKICGLRDEAMIDVALDAGADHIGFVHYEKSPRHVGLDRLAELSAYVADRAITWAVTASPDLDLLQALADIEHLYGVQSHGIADQDGFKAIREARDPMLAYLCAISVGGPEDLAAASSVPDASSFLFDAKPRPSDVLPGGNGVAFDWSVMRGFECDRPWMLAGGLTPDNVAEAIRQSGAYAVDVSSGIESAPGVKDPTLIAQFVKAAKSV